MFYADSVLQSSIFLYLATEWKDIIAYWHKMEKPFLFEPYTMRGIKLPLKTRLIGFIFLIFFLTEHLMFLSMALYESNNQLVMCNVSNVPALQNFMRRLRPHLLDFLPITGVFFQFFNGPSRVWCFVGILWTTSS